MALDQPPKVVLAMRINRASLSRSRVIRSFCTLASVDREEEEVESRAWYGHAPESDIHPDIVRSSEVSFPRHWKTIGGPTTSWFRVNSTANPLYPGVGSGQFPREDPADQNSTADDGRHVFVLDRTYHRRSDHSYVHFIVS